MSGENAFASLTIAITSEGIASASLKAAITSGGTVYLPRMMSRESNASAARTNACQAAYSSLGWPDEDAGAGERVLELSVL